MPSKPDIWMPLYIGDYLAATTHLSAEESGGYLHLLMHQWKNGSLPADSESLRRIARVEKDAWSNAWAVLELFFDDATGCPVQLKLERIRTEWQAKKDSATTKASNAAAKRWSKDAPSIAQAMPQSCPSSSSSPSVSTNVDTNKGKFTKQQMEAIYTAYPRKVGKGAALKSIAKASSHIEFVPLLEKVNLYRAQREGQDSQFTPHPSTWFNEMRWDDETLQAKPKAIVFKGFDDPAYLEYRANQVAECN